MNVPEILEQALKAPVDEETDRAVREYLDQKDRYYDKDFRDMSGDFMIPITLVVGLVTLLKGK